MHPVRDPLRSLVYVAADRAVRDVYVDGRKVVADRKVLTLDQEAASARLDDAQHRAAGDIPRHDWAGRTVDQFAPRSLSLASPRTRAAT